MLAACAVWAGLAADALAQGSVESDRAALEALYDATGGAGWTNSTNWKSAAPLGEWYGVTTDAEGRVIWLELPGNGLVGTIPAALGDLVFLQDLHLGRRWDSTSELWVENALTGPIPPALGRLVNLRSLSLDSNDLTGPIPAELGSLANLERLQLGDNVLIGPVPTWLGRLTSLRSLGLDSNDLTGPIPAELGNLANLERLRLGDNTLTGPVPSWLGNLVNLWVLGLDSNDLTGPIPAKLGNLANLGYLYLDSNTLTGPIPVELGDLGNLEWLNIGWNPLTGSLPRSLTTLSQLRWLDFAYTGACAPADAEFQAWLATIGYRGDTCNLPPEPVGTIPTQALAASGPALGVSMEVYFSDPNDDPLTYSAASSHDRAVTAFASDDTVWLVPGVAGAATVTVTARDPDGLSATQIMDVTTAASAGPQNDREILEVLYDSTGGPNWTNGTNWKTSAPVSEWYGVTTDSDGRVTALRLDGNGLAGPIPRELGNLARLGWLDLYRNALTGPIPHELGNLVNLRTLELWGNDLSGPIPGELGNLANLQSLDLSSNDLSGLIPGGFRNLVNLRMLELGSNDLSGPIPDELGNLVNLQSLGLSWNDLAGPIPDELGNLVNLEALNFSKNALTGPVPAWFGGLARLRSLSLSLNDFTGRIPDELEGLENLEVLDLSFNWGLSGPLPPGVQVSRVLDIYVTQACAPAPSRDWLETIKFLGQVCGSGTDVTIDAAVFYTPAAREAVGGDAAIAAVVDLMVAEANLAYEASGIHHRLALVERAEVAYTEIGDSGLDLGRLADPADGYMDEVHTVRDRVGADLVHLIVDSARSSVAGIANFSGAFGLSIHSGGGGVFAHELGHNMGLKHERYQDHGEDRGDADPAYGYVNQSQFEAGAALGRRWHTIMAYGSRCAVVYTACSRVLRFSNPRQSYNGDPLGVAYGEGSGVTGPADAAAVLNATGPAVALWRDRPTGANRTPTTVETLPDRELTLPGTLNVDVSRAFADPEGDPLTYAASSSAPNVVAVSAAGARVTLTAASAGTATIRVTATDPGGLSAAQSFTVTVATTARAPFTDDPLRPGVTAIRAVHLTELRDRIDALREAAGLGRFRWTDPVLRAGVTPVRLVHLTELRSALAAAYTAAGRSAPPWTDPTPVAGSSAIRAVHLTELRSAVVALE